MFSFLKKSKTTTTKKTDKINLKINNFSLFSLPRTDILSINYVNFSKYTGI